jgi:hypothetical protein
VSLNKVVEALIKLPMPQVGSKITLGLILSDISL